jgi:hypothetical protein
LADQRLDVAVDRAKGHAELVGQRLTADRMAMPAQHLDELEQAFRARHARLPS